MNDDSLVKRLTEGFTRNTRREGRAVAALADQVRQAPANQARAFARLGRDIVGGVQAGLEDPPISNQPALTPRPTASGGAAGKIINPARAVSPDILGTAEQQGLGTPQQNLQDRLNQQRLNDRNLTEIPGQNVLNQAELFPNQPRGEQVTQGLGQDPLANVLSQGQLFPEVGRQDPTKPPPPPQLFRGPVDSETIRGAALADSAQQPALIERSLLPGNQEQIQLTNPNGNRATIIGKEGFRERERSRQQRALTSQFGTDDQGRPNVPLPSRGTFSATDFSAGRQATQENIGRLDKQLAEIERQNLIKNANAQVSLNQSLGSFLNAASRRKFAKQRLTALEKNTATATQNALTQSATAKEKRLDRQAKSADERFKLSANAEQDALTRQHTSGENQLTRNADTKAASLKRQTEKSEFLNEPVVIESTEMVKGFPVTKKNTFFRRFDPDLKRMVLFNPETGERRPI